MHGVGAKRKLIFPEEAGACRLKAVNSISLYELVGL
jgi:hypothetical protein